MACSGTIRRSAKSVSPTTVTTWLARVTEQMDYWITAGDTPAEISRQYAAATGTAPMLPDYAAGFWQCKLRYRTQEELLEVAREYKRRGLPLSVIVADFFHWPNQGEWRFDPREWPDPKAMVEELKEMGIELMVSIWPTVDNRTENYKIMKSKGYLVSTERGVPVNMTFLGNTDLLRCDPSGRAPLCLGTRPRRTTTISASGSSGWTKPNPNSASTTSITTAIISGRSSKSATSIPAIMPRLSTRACARRGRPRSSTCCAVPGQAASVIGALVWSGDINSTFGALRNQLVAGLNMGIAGIPWWTTDIGGFDGGNINDPAFQELLIRWFQWGVFCPVTRLHGYRQPTEPPAEPIATASRNAIPVHRTKSGAMAKTTTPS